MYRDHFGLAELPFSLTPNTDFYLNAQGHREAFNLLQVAISSGEGFIKVVGEVGTGKTMLCRQLLNTLEEPYYTAYIPNPYLEPPALYAAVADELGVEYADGSSVHALQKSINQRLIELVEQGRSVVLVIDEAQAMPVETLEALRLISNLETETRKLLQVVLFGQPELDQLLSQPSLRQLRQRITFAYALAPLDREGTHNYIQHRINRAGHNGDRLFTERATGLLHRASGGIPRLVNILCHKALMCAYGKGHAQVDEAHVAAAVRDTEGVKLPNRKVVGLAIGGLALAVLALALFSLRSAA